jgi:hypothetical protein
LQPTDAIGQMTIESANASAPPPSPSQAPSAYNKSDPAIQQAMVEQFSQQSGMKSEWSRQCLEDQNWDFEVAFENF